MRNEQANDEKPQLNINEMQQNSTAHTHKKKKRIVYVFSVQLMTGIINKIKFIQLSVQYAVCKSNNRKLTQVF